MRIEPAELAIVQLGMQRNFVARTFWNVQTKMGGVRRSRRDQMDVNHRASGPRISLVDGIPVPIDLQRTIEVRPRLDRTFAIVLHFPAPENRLAFFICGLQFKPNIESVNCAAGEEVPNFAGAYNDIHASVIAPAHRRIGAIEGSGYGSDLAGWALRKRNVRFFSYGEGRREF